MRLKNDPRNQLIIPTVEIVKKLRPQWLLLENVQGIQLTQKSFIGNHEITFFFYLL